MRSRPAILVIIAIVVTGCATVTTTVEAPKGDSPTLIYGYIDHSLLGPVEGPNDEVTATFLPWDVEMIIPEDGTGRMRLTGNIKLRDQIDLVAKLHDGLLVVENLPPGDYYLTSVTWRRGIYVQTGVGPGARVEDRSISEVASFERPPRSQAIRVEPGELVYFGAVRVTGPRRAAILEPLDMDQQDILGRVDAQFGPLGWSEFIDEAR